MQRKPTLLIAAAVLAVAGVYSASAILRAARVLRASTDTVEREGRIAFSAAVLDRQIPAGFEAVQSPAGFQDAAVFGNQIFIGGAGGLFEYSASGDLLRSFRTGIELPAAPVTALATGLAVGSVGRQLWIATAGEGALVYDGSRFRQIRAELAGARKLTSVLPLATGRVLFGGATEGVLAFDGEHLAPLHPSLRGLHVTALAGEESSLWIGTEESGVLHWHAGQLDRYGEPEGLPDPHVFAIAVAADSAYAATVSGVAEIRDGRIQRTLAPGFTVQSVLVHGGELFAGTLGEGLRRTPLESRTKAGAALASGCADCSISRVLIAGGATLALTKDGLYRAGPEWSALLTSSEARLTDRNISALAPDAEGRVWIGYFDRGLDILDLNTQRVRHIEDDAVFCVNRIVHDTHRDRTAVATANGLALFGANGEKRQVLTRADGLIASQITDVLFQPDGTMLAGTPAGVSFIEPARISSVYAFHGLVNNHVYTLGQMGSRTLVGTLGGLSTLESGLVTASYTISNSGFKHNWVTALQPVGNDVFVGTYGGGILHTAPGGAWTTFDGFPASFEVNPNAMAASSRAVYAGTLDRGLALYDRASERWRWITRGLPSLNVTAVAIEAGVVYIGTDNGLVRVPEGSLLQ